MYVINRTNDLDVVLMMLQDSFWIIFCKLNLIIFSRGFYVEEAMIAGFINNIK